MYKTNIERRIVDFPGSFAGVLGQSKVSLKRIGTWKLKLKSRNIEMVFKQYVFRFDHVHC